MGHTKTQTSANGVVWDQKGFQNLSGGFDSYTPCQKRPRSNASGSEHTHRTQPISVTCYNITEVSTQNTQTPPRSFYT